MASIVAYIELREGTITRPSRYAVAEARRVADAAGATVYALLTVGSLTQTEIDQLAAEVSAAGADRILCSAADSLAGPPLDVTHGPLLAQVAGQLRPVLFLFPAGGAGTELGPPLAVRIGAAYQANASIDMAGEDRAPDLASQRVVLTRWRAAGDGQRRIDVGDLERPVVASLACGVSTASLGESYAEVEMIPCPEAGHTGPRLLASEADSTAGSELCSSMIWSLSELPPATREALPAELPVGVVLVVATGRNTPSIEAASPRDLFVLSSASGAEAQSLPRLAPGATVTHVRAKTEVPS
jgi:hypothetical protein